MLLSFIAWLLNRMWGLTIQTLFEYLKNGLIYTKVSFSSKNVLNERVSCRLLEYLAPRRRRTSYRCVILSSLPRLMSAADSPTTRPSGFWSNVKLGMDNTKLDSFFNRIVSRFYRGSYLCKLSLIKPSLFHSSWAKWTTLFKDVYPASHWVGQFLCKI